MNDSNSTNGTDGTDGTSGIGDDVAANIEHTANAANSTSGVGPAEVEVEVEAEADVLASLRAADPAAGIEPRAGFADGVIARAVAGATDVAASITSEESAPATDQPATDQPDAVQAPVHDLSAERERRRPRWLPLVAVAASLAIVGGAGFGIGTATGSSTVAAGSAAPAISLQSGLGAGAAGGAGGSAAAESSAFAGGFTGAMGAQSDAMGRSSKLMYPWGFGRNVFTSSGLSDAQSSAPAYTFDAAGASNATTVGALGAALGVDGAAELKDGSWVMGVQDGTALSLSVGLDAALSFYFNNPAINPWQCDGALLDDGSTEPCAPPANLPSEAAAIDALRALITATGRDANAFEYTSDSWEGAFTRMAQAWPVMNGQRLDQSWSIEVTDAGTVSASGALAAIVPLGEYSVASEQQAFERLSDPRFGAQMTALPIAMRELQSTEEYQEWVPPTEPPAMPAAGSSVSWPVNTVAIVSARLGLASQWQPDGSILIVPAYEFTDAGGGTWSVIAVADSMLDFASNEVE